ncbi:MAG: hypothetical protein Q8M94_04160 [Ignavibacteria bacterium]|nr:hypothetical protein [Ignavibacteria bacterium]
MEIRRIIKEKGIEFYFKLSKSSKNLQYIAEELMTLNEDYAMNHKNNIGTSTILNTGFTENQKILLLELEKELKKMRRNSLNLFDAAPRNEGQCDALNNVLVELKKANHD